MKLNQILNMYITWNIYFCNVLYLSYGVFHSFYSFFLKLLAIAENPSSNCFPTWINAFLKVSYLNYMLLTNPHNIPRWQQEAMLPPNVSAWQLKGVAVGNILGYVPIICCSSTNTP